MEGKDGKRRGYKRRGSNENGVSKIKKEILQQSRINFVIKFERNI